MGARSGSASGVGAQRDLRISIIGAGMSGLVMGIRLKRAGIHDFRIYEQASQVGGTWRENTYPGLTCDVPSFFYSYSFEPNPDWSHRFSPGPEIQAYFEGVAERYGLLPHIEFDTRVTSARYADGVWTLGTEHGDSHEADVLIQASGPLHHKKIPKFDGLETFAGAWFHSAAWDHDVPLEGERIGVVGTGSTAVQMMKPLSEVAGRVTMFQRTAQWIMPIGNKPYSERERRLTRRFPILAYVTRRFYKSAFERFSTGVTEDGANRRRLSAGCRKHLASIPDPELRAKLTPDYEPGCKRLVLSRNFYATMQKENVDLVVEGIERVEPQGVVTRDGRLHELDVLVLATGFNPHAWGVDTVVGAEGQSLREAWASGTRSYRSVAMPGFPNFFMLVGPNSPIGNISIIDVSETQSGYILDCIKLLQRGEAVALAPNREATARFHESLLAAMQNTIWVTGCNSWYLDEDGVPLTWPWSPKRFHKELRRPDFADYDRITA